MDLHSGRPVTLFLIEDDDIDAETVQRAMHKHRIGNPVVRATNGVEALAMLNTEEVRSPFVILLDLNMPRMNGIEFLQKLREHPVHKQSVVFVLTTSDAECDVMQAYEHMVAGYFMKNDAQNSVSKLVEVLGGYWQIVYLPDSHNAPDVSEESGT